MTPDRPDSPESKPPVAWAAPVETTGPAPGIEFAPHGPRVVAYLIDSIIVTVVALAIVLVPIVWAQGRVDAVRAAGGVAEVDGLVIVALIVAFAALFGVILGYFPFFWARGGQTPGMRPFGLWVVGDRDGTAISWRSAVLRMVAMYFVSSVLYLGFIWIFIDKRRRSWHDLVAGTVVIRRA
ncbi:MAG: RDD family protein [Candidatus Limnocylindrales bacterium]